MKKLQKICLRAIAAIGAFIFLALTYYAWQYTARMYTDDEALVVIRDSKWSMLLFLIGMLAIVYGLSRLGERLTKKKVHILACGVSVAVVIGLCILIKSANAYPLGVDQQYMYKIAVSMASGSYGGMNTGEYFSVYPYQISLVWIYALLYRIFGGDSAALIQYVHAVCTGISIYAGYRITKELFDSVRAECMYLLCILGLLPLYLYVLFIYGETLGICGALLSVWFYLMANRQEKQNRYLVMGYWLLATMGLTLAYFARSALLIVWVAMAILQLLTFLTNRKPLRLVMTVLMIVAALSSQQFVLSTVEKQAKVQLDEGMPSLLGIAMGLQGDVDKGGRPGSENAYAWNLFQNCDFNPEEASEEAGEYIHNRLLSWSKDPQRMIVFFREKILNQWNEPSYGAFTMTRFMNNPDWWVKKMYYGKGNTILYHFLNQYQAVIYLLLFGYFLCLWKRAKSPKDYLPGLIVIGGFLFSVIWEAKSRYVFPYVVIVIPCVAGSVVWYYDKTITLVKKRILYIRKKVWDKRGERYV